MKGPKSIFLVALLVLISAAGSVYDVLIRPKLPEGPISENPDILTYLESEGYRKTKVAFSLNHYSKDGILGYWLVAVEIDDRNGPETGIEFSISYQILSLTMIRYKEYRSFE